MPAYIQEAKPRLQCSNLDTKGNTLQDHCADLLAVKPQAASFQPDQARDLQSSERQESIEMNLLQSKFIDETMTHIRKREVANQAATKRQKTLTLRNNDSEPSSSEHRTESSSKSNGTDWTSIFLDRLNRNPSVAQIVATSGGLVTYWNEAFSSITRPSTSLHEFPTTMFELIDSKSLPLLYSMLALALHNNSIVEAIPLDQVEQVERSSGSSHLSITLPCKSFRGDSSLHYNITIIYMNDLSSRCFVGILTPSPPIKASESKISDIHSSSSDDSHCDCHTSFSDISDDSWQKEEIRTGIESQDHGTNERLTIGKMLRLKDDHLCQLIFGPK